MLGKLGELNKGYNVLTEMAGQHKDMLMDIGIYNMSQGKEETLLDSNNETAILLLEGKVKLEWEGHSKEIQRESLLKKSLGVCTFRKMWRLKLPRLPIVKY